MTVVGAQIYLGLVYDFDDILGRGGVYKPEAHIRFGLLIYDFDDILSRGGANVPGAGI